MTKRKGKQESKKRRKAIGYVRVSADQQADSGLGLEAQEEKIRALADKQDLDLSSVIKDTGKSAKSFKRPGMEQVLDLAKYGETDAVIVQKLDRLTRSVRDLADLLDLFAKKDVALVSVTEGLDTNTKAGRLVSEIMGVVAQWEDDDGVEKTSTAAQSIEKKVKRLGGVPIGYKVSDDGLHMIVSKEERFVAGEIKRMRFRGKSYQAIADHLNEKKLRNRRDVKWTRQRVHYWDSAFTASEKEIASIGWNSRPDMLNDK
jgi:site-specific DNA recombinase